MLTNYKVKVTVIRSLKCINHDTPLLPEMFLVHSGGPAFSLEGYICVDLNCRTKTDFYYAPTFESVLVCFIYTSC